MLWHQTVVIDSSKPINQTDLRFDYNFLHTVIGNSCVCVHACVKLVSFFSEAEDIYTGKQILNIAEAVSETDASIIQIEMNSTLPPCSQTHFSG